MAIPIPIHKKNKAIDNKHEIYIYIYNNNRQNLKIIAAHKTSFLIFRQNQYRLNRNFIILKQFLYGPRILG